MVDKSENPGWALPVSDPSLTVSAASSLAAASPVSFGIVSCNSDQEATSACGTSSSSSTIQLSILNANDGDDTKQSTTCDGMTIHPSSVFHPRDRKGRVRLLFVCFVLGQVFVNYDAGAIPSVLTEIKKEFDLSDVLLGFLGSLPYVGLIVVSPVIGILLQTMSQKTLIVISLLSNVGAVVMLALSFNIYVLFVSRFLLGVTQSGFCIYCPVWVDEFSGVKFLTMWMGLIQGGTVFGIMLGYLVTGYLPEWRISIAIQGGILVLLLIFFLFTPALYINLYTHSKLSEDGNAPSSRQTETVVRFEAGETRSDEHPDIPIEPAMAVPISDHSYMNRLNTPFTDERTGLEVEYRNGSMRPLAEFHKGRFVKFRSGVRSQQSQQLMLPTDCGLPTPNRAPSFIAASPGGSVLTTMDMAVSYGSLFVLRPSESKESLPKQTSSGDKEEERAEPQSVALEQTAIESVTLWEQFIMMFHSAVYLCTVISLTSLFFVVTGIQYWSTIWLIIEKKADEAYIRLAFSVTAASAPTAGVFWGSFFVDWLGGYKTERGVYKTLIFCFISGCLATVSGVVASYLDNVYAILGLIWVTLFFGGSTLPPNAGINISAVDPSVRPFASSFSIFFYNLFGFAAGTFFPSMFVQMFGLNTGMRVIFLWSLVGVTAQGFALYYSRKNSRAQAPLASPPSKSSTKSVNPMQTLIPD